MADKSISQLSPGVAVTDTDLLPNVQVVGVGPVKTTAVQIKTYVNTDPNVTGVIKAQLGSAAAPSYTFDGDLNTGWWSPAADTLAASTGGTERIRINSSGNIGVGITPSAWQTAGNTNAVEFLAGSNWSFSTTAFFMSQNSYIASGGVRTYKTTAAATEYAQTAGQHQWFNAASGTAGNAITFTQAMTLNASGNLGIGTTSPSYRFHAVVTSGAIGAFRGTSAANSYLLVGNTAGDLLIQANASGDAFITADTSKYLALGSNSTERMRIDANGNVGIGTISPSFRLDVVNNAAGLVRFSFSNPNAGMTQTDIRIGAGSSTNDVFIGIDGTGSFIDNRSTSGVFRIQQSGTERFRIDSSGRVGIGTINPTYKLVVVGGNASTLLLDNAGEQYTQLTLQRNGTLNTGGDFLIDGTSSEFLIRALLVGPMKFMTSATAGAAAERMRIDSAGNVGIGVTPASWATVLPVLQANQASFTGYNNQAILSSNWYFNAGNKYIANGFASQYSQAAGVHTWYTAPSGTAGNAITFTQVMTLGTDGTLLIGGSGSTPGAANANPFLYRIGGGGLAIGAATETGTTAPIAFYTAATERMRITSAGNVGIGVTPVDCYGRSIQMLQSGGTSGSILVQAIGADNMRLDFLNNALPPAGGYTGGYNYQKTGDSATRYCQVSGQHQWFTAAPGTAGNAITFTQAMTLAATGNLAIGTTNPFAWRVVVSQAGDQALQLANSTGNGNRVLFSDQTWSAEIVHSVGNLLFRPGGGSTDKLTIDGAGNVVVNNAAIATNAVNGFLYVPGCAGAPTGTPTAYPGRVPIVVDTTNNKLYFYSGGAWRDAGP